MQVCVWCYLSSTRWCGSCYQCHYLWDMCKGCYNSPPRFLVDFCVSQTLLNRLHRCLPAVKRLYSHGSQQLFCLRRTTVVHGISLSTTPFTDCASGMRLGSGTLGFCERATGWASLSVSLSSSEPFDWLGFFLFGDFLCESRAFEQSCCLFFAQHTLE